MGQIERRNADIPYGGKLTLNRGKIFFRLFYGNHRFSLDTFPKKCRYTIWEQIKEWNNHEDKNEADIKKYREKYKTVAQKQSGRERYYWEGNVFRPWFHQICFSR